MKVLVVEDNLEVAQLIKEVLKEDEVLNVQIQDPDFSKIPSERIDALLLDEDLNGMSGLDFLDNFRKEKGSWNGPVIMITGLDDEKTIQKAFDRGVDDYVVKPFKPSVLRGKLKALSFRCGLLGSVLKAGPIEVDVSQHRVAIEGRDVPLTLTEYKIVRELASRPGLLVTREELRDKAFDGMHVTNRTIDVHICSVRKKIKEAGDPLKTVRGVGYRLAV